MIEMSGLKHIKYTPKSDEGKNAKRHECEIFDFSFSAIFLLAHNKITSIVVKGSNYQLLHKTD
jgi:hypothetical protein